MSRTLSAKGPYTSTSAAITSASQAAAMEQLKNQPGTFMTIPVTELKVDTEYQRALAGNRVDRIAKEWSWISCGALIVALRGAGSGDYYVIDGQHRLEGAIRVGLKELPCLVFETVDHVVEAQGFLDTNTVRKAMSVVDRYRALLVVKDPTALEVARLLETAGREADTRTTGAYAATRISCIDTMMACVNSDLEKLEAIWPLIIDLCENRLISKRIIQGMFYLERHLVNRSLTERHWRRRLMSIGYDAIHKSMQDTAIYEGSAGAAVMARGVLRAINHGLRNKLKVEINTASSASAEEDDE